MSHHARPAGHRRQTGSEGFTLVEVVVVVALMALVAVALGAAFTAIIRTTPTAENRVEDANALLGLTNWLPQDVASTDETGFVVAPYTASCSGTTGDALVQLTWSAGGNTYTSDYRFVDGAPGLGAIVRHSCTNGQPATSLELTSPLRRIAGSPPVDVTLVAGGAGHRGLEFIVRVLDDDGVTIRDLVALDAFTTNIHTTLPATTVPSGPTTTSGTNQPPVAYDIWVTVQEGVHTPSTPYIIDLPAFDPDGPEPNYLDYDYPPPPPVPEPVALIPFASGRSVGVAAIGPPYTPGPHTFTYTVEDAAFPGVTATADITVTIIPNSATSTSTTAATTTTVPCVADIVSVSPNSTGIEPNGKLDDSIEVTITSSGSCRPFVLSFDPDPTDTDLTPEEIPFNGSTTVTIDKNTDVWNQAGPFDWSFPLELRQGSNGPISDTATLTVTP